MQTISIKSDTRQQRLFQFRRSHNLSLSSPLPVKEMAMRMTDNKQQLTEMARNDLIKNISARANKLIITVPAEALEQIQLGVQ